MGSVKDLEHLMKFTFSSRKSIKDWGQMPNDFDGTGEALCIMAAKTNELLAAAGVNTAYIGLLEDNTIKGLDNLTSPTNIMIVEYFPVVKPNFDNKTEKWDYTWFDENRGHYDGLIPLECIYRNGLPRGSSVFRNFRNLDTQLEVKEITQELFEIKEKVMLDELGLTERPVEGQWLPEPVYMFTTKHEPKDRRLSRDEAMYISGLTDEQFVRLEDFMKKANKVITDHCESIGFDNWDGKFEVGIKDGEFYILDVAGTFDENRFTINEKFIEMYGYLTDDSKETLHSIIGLQISKEPLRQIYDMKQPDWVTILEAYQEKFKAELPDGRKEWKVKMVEEGHVPKPLEDIASGFHENFINSYMAGCNLYVGRDIFDVPHLILTALYMKENNLGVFAK